MNAEIYTLVLSVIVAIITMFFIGFAYLLVFKYTLWYWKYSRNDEECNFWKFFWRF